MILSRLSDPLQLDHLHSRFEKLNPDSDPTLIDWEARLDHSLTMAENFGVFAKQYPQYRWELGAEHNPYYDHVLDDV